MDNVCANELFEACQILFGPEVDIGSDFLNYIQPGGIKSAFRLVARDTHPDVAAEDSTDRFIEARRAYERLQGYIEHRDNFRGPGEMSAAGSAPGGRAREAKAPHRASFYKGSMPMRVLLFGEFLFYSREVTWESLFKAVAWQRGKRPRLGEFALRWGWLDSHKIGTVLRARRGGERIGETIVRLRYCTRLQVSTMVMAQRRQQPRIGDYFLTAGLLDAHRLNNEIYRKFVEHNKRYPGKGVTGSHTGR